MGRAGLTVSNKPGDLEDLSNRRYYLHGGWAGAPK